MSNLRFTSDITDDFFPRLKAIAEELEADPLHMLAVMYSESGVRATAHNDNPKNLPPEQRYNASGLIQFMPPTLVGLGYFSGHAAFRQLTATAQLNYVRKYYLPYKGKLKSAAALYVATFLPAFVDNASDMGFVLTAKGGIRGWAFAPNAAFDADGDLKITVKELGDAVARNAKGGRWDELAARLTGEGLPEEATEAPPADLRTTFGLQCALKAAGFDPGPLDGQPGPKTTAAVLAFQEANGLKPDGIYGPKTRAAFEQLGKKAPTSGSGDKPPKGNKAA